MLKLLFVLFELFGWLADLRNSILRTILCSWLGVSLLLLDLCLQQDRTGLRDFLEENWKSFMLGLKRGWPVFRSVSSALTLR